MDDVNNTLVPNNDRTMSSYAKHVEIQQSCCNVQGFLSVVLFLIFMILHIQMDGPDLLSNRGKY